VLFSLAAGVLLLANFPMEVLVGLSLVYLVSIPFSIRRFRQLRRADALSASP
jgi:CDP-diacylglycerol--serine O-phosphatidyltransferase